MFVSKSVLRQAGEDSLDSIRFACFVCLARRPQRSNTAAAETTMAAAILLSPISVLYVVDNLPDSARPGSRRRYRRYRYTHAGRRTGPQQKNER